MVKKRINRVEDENSSEDEIDLSKLDITVEASDTEEEGEEEVDFQIDETSDDTLKQLGEEDEEDEYPSSDTELSDEEEEDKDNDLIIEPEYKPKKGGNNFNKKLPEIDPVYDSDSSTEETNNTVGNIPMEWYDDYPHIGYDVDGKRIFRPAGKDELDKFLSTMDDPDGWKTVKDKLEGKDVKLSEEELQIIKRLTEGKQGQEGYEAYPDLIEFFTNKVEPMPLSGAIEPKRRFVPSVSEHKKIMKIVKAIRAGRIVGKRPVIKQKPLFDMWANEANQLDNNFIPPPKKPLPTNAESYNPPEEYLFDDEEKKTWLETEPNERKQDFVPSKYNNFRSIPAYSRSYQESFRRCLDLYMNPRVRKSKIDIDPESLVPKLPDPKDLQPFPTKLSLVFDGHKAKVRTTDFAPDGLYVASGSDDGTVKIWELKTGRCLSTLDLGTTIHNVAWNPSEELALIAVTTGDSVVMYAPDHINDALKDNTVNTVQAGFAIPKTENIGQWRRPTPNEQAKHIILVLNHNHTVKQVTWHRKGDYFATLAPKDGPDAVMIHQLSKHSSQRPFRKLKGSIQAIQFHPTKPHFLIATQRYVRIYNLQQAKLERTLNGNVQWISSLDVHPQGDNVLIGSYDRKLAWFDLDLSSKPYKTLRFHREAIRSVTYHKRYPLFASSSDDNTIQVFHGTAYTDLLKNPLIVPVKVLRGHVKAEQLAILSVKFHPHQPWLLSAGADGKLALFT